MVMKLKLILAAGILVAGGLLAGPADLNLIPWPVSVQSKPGEFALNQKTAVTADAAFTNEAALLAGQLHLDCAPVAEDNRIRLTTAGADGLGDEAYRLDVDADGATIHARTAAGAFYGCQTLRQLAAPDAKTIPFVQITDAPRYAWRGLMLDVSRHFFDKPTVLRVLDWMADYKLNRFHLHLTDDSGWRVEIPKYPELTRAGARGNFSDTNAPPRFFTREDLREIVAYAARRHIVVVPEIDMPGHASAATRTFPELDGGTHTFNPAREETYVFLQNVLRDVMEIFPSPWIHFGGDEVNVSQWQVTEKLKSDGIESPAQMENYFVRRMAGFISQQGRTPVGWDEIVAARPATNTVVFWWRHNKPEMLAQALAAGYSVVLTPRSPCYLDYPQDKSYPQIGWKLCNTPEAVYAGPKIPADISPAQREGILGVEACVWAERIGTVPYLEFMLLPRLAALGETAWTPEPRRDFTQFSNRLAPFLSQYRQLGIRFYDANNPADSLRAARGLQTSAAK
jgi:hexosaminidase